MHGGHSTGRIEESGRVQERAGCLGGRWAVLRHRSRVRPDRPRVSEPQIEPGGRLLGGPAAYEPRTPWGASAALAATVAIGGAAFLSAWLLPPHPAISPPGLWAIAIFQIVAVALTLLASFAFGGHPRDVLALRRAPRGWRTYAGALLAMVVLQVGLAAVTYNLVEHDMLNVRRAFVGLVTGPYWLLAVAVLAIGAPLSEELLFRGFLQGALAKSPLGFWGAAPISTLLWTGLHTGYSLAGLAEVFAI